MSFRLERTIERRRMDGECDAAYGRLEDWAFEVTYGVWEAREKLAEGHPTHIYAIREGDAVKIGLARKPAERVRQLQIGNPRPLLLYATAPATLALEQHLHGVLAAEHRRGEWFDVNDRVLTVCSFIASMGEQCDDLAATGESPTPEDGLYALTSILDDLVEGRFAA